MDHKLVIYLTFRVFDSDGTDYSYLLLSYNIIASFCLLVLMPLLTGKLRTPETLVLICATAM